MKRQLENLRVHMVTLCVDRDYARKEELQRKYRRHGLNKAETAEFRALVFGCGRTEGSAAACKADVG